jgi:hypothetical protein
MNIPPHIDRFGDIRKILVDYFHTARVSEVCESHETRTLPEKERRTEGWTK